MGSTNYYDTFIEVAPDCPAATGEVPPGEGTVARIQHDLIVARPCQLTSDDVLFEVHAVRRAIPGERRAAEREAFFAKPQACLRSSPLTAATGGASTVTVRAGWRSTPWGPRSTEGWRRIPA